MDPFDIRLVEAHVVAVNIFRISMSSNYRHGNLRQALLDQAIEILASTGEERLSLRALARDLNVGHAVPLRHFKTKVDLLAAIAIEGMQSLIRDIRRLRTLPRGTQQLFGMSTAYVDWATQHPAFFQALRNPRVLRHASHQMSDILAEVGQCQRAGILQAQGANWRCRDDPEALQVHLTTLTVGAAMIATDPAYPKQIGIAPTRNSLLAPIREFLNLNDNSANSDETQVTL